MTLNTYWLIVAPGMLLGLSLIGYLGLLRLRASAREKHFADFTEVTLTHAVDVQGVHLPAGAHGVVVAADGRAYEVEF